MKDSKKRNSRKSNQIIPLNNLEKSIDRIRKPVFKIELDGNYGTGFFCYIKSKNIKVLLTNNHVLDQNILDKKKTLEISFYLNGEILKKEINIDGNRIKYTDKDLDFTIIEILEDDNISEFLEVDENYDNCENKQILISQIAEGCEVGVSFGVIKKKYEDKIIYECPTNEGSSGAPLVLIENSKVIAFHRASYKNRNIKIGIPIKLIINIIYSISCKYFIERKNIGIEIQIISDIYFSQNPDKKMLIKGKILPIKAKYKFDTEGEQNIYFMQEDYISNNIIYLNQMFLNCTYLIEIYFLNYKVNKMIELSKMFNGCSSLKKVNLFSFDAFNEQDLSGMFDGCSSLEEINYISFNAFNAVNLSNMFNCCTSLKKIDLKSFETDHVKDMSNMFRKCNSLEEIDLSSIKTNEVENMSNMFEKSKSLKIIKLSSNKFEKPINMNRMFFGYSSLENIFFPSKRIENEKVKNKNDKLNVIFMTELFYNCKNLKQIDLSIFNTEYVQDMTSILKGCSSLMKIDLSSFNVNKVKNMNNIFSECILLEEIKLFDLNEINDAVYMPKMFFNCSNLKHLYIPTNF